ncbi:MAG: glycosyltransferase family 2 protein [Candidatus Omnitrophica bacterium]|nr:glycosyltransferase family 2 protein [Candidatus Omnitrophota bacterium]
MNPRVSIIILNRNGWKDTIECLESLYQITYDNYDVIVVDNGSGDRSMEKIREYADGKIKVQSDFVRYKIENKPIKVIEYTRDEVDSLGVGKNAAGDTPTSLLLVLIKNERNYGFAEGNNIGIKYAIRTFDPEYIYLLNNDAVVDPHILDELVKVAGSDPNIGIAGSKNFLYRKPDVIQLAGGMIDYNFVKARCIGAGKRDTGQYEDIRHVGFVDGSSLLVKREVIDSAGMLDTDYFAYMDDPDLCVRALKKGYKTVYVPKAKMWHKVSGTAGKKSPFLVYYTTRNKFLFIKKHGTTLQIINFFVLFTMLHFPLALIYYLVLGRIPLARAFLKGTIDGAAWSKGKKIRNSELNI